AARAAGARGANRADYQRAAPNGNVRVRRRRSLRSHQRTRHRPRGHEREGRRAGKQSSDGARDVVELMVARTTPGQSGASGSERSAAPDRADPTTFNEETMNVLAQTESSSWGPIAIILIVF